MTAAAGMHGALMTPPREALQGLENRPETRAKKALEVFEWAQ